MSERVLVAMSGGVDSSAAALLLRRQGLEPVGLNLQLLDGLCPAAGEDPAAAARAAADALGMELTVLDRSDLFRREVAGPFAASYERGETPNPCVGCNRMVKFAVLLEQAEALGCARMATGHYARTGRDGTGRPLLKKGLDPAKDQSYALCSLTRAQLERTVFPLGELTKQQVRELARESGLPNADRGDSQDICFIPDGDYAAFIRRYTGRDYPPGPFLDEQGGVLGAHRGIIHYTVGQRRGLGLALPAPLYVKEKDAGRNAVVLAPDQALYTGRLRAGKLNLLACDRLDGPVRLLAKIRYRHREQPCTVVQTGEDTLSVVFDEPQRAITPGQTLALYDGDTVVAGAVILG